MQGRSIRSIALDYYRKRGAEIRPLDGAEAYEIVSSDGAKLAVTFSDEAPVENGPAPLTATSPQWRAILEDLTAEVAVSYRYLVAGPIANPAATLSIAAPAGWRVTHAKLKHVDHRMALGVTHRATFDSPALNACQEQIYQHLWDIATEERLTVLEPTLYQTPCILLRPENLPGAGTVQALADRSAEIVDVDSETHGQLIEKELAGLLAEAERRTNQYFDQQMGNVLAREVQVSEKLDGMIRKLTEAKTPEQIARYRQEGLSLQDQLSHLQANRERDLQAVESACLAKLAQEREKHELTATIDLVALCHASYDVLTYQATVQSPEGRQAEWELRYWPLTRELTFPDCPACRHPMEHPVLLENAHAVCSHCTTACGGCGALHDATSFVAGACPGCGEHLCPQCAASCAHCDGAACEAHVVACATCEAPLCPSCTASCGVCETALCEGHAHWDDAHEQAYCEAHQDARLVEALPAVTPAVTIVSVTAIAKPVEVAAPQPIEVAAPLPVEAPAPEAPTSFIELTTVVSKLSGKKLDSRVAETCHACLGTYDVQEMHNCATCGVPACLPCTEGEWGPCPACASLDDVQPDDARLAFVTANFPELRKGRHWAIAELGPYVVAHWRRLGHWGMVVYHQGDAPVVLTEFSYGPLETAGMAMRSWWGK